MLFFVFRFPNKYIQVTLEKLFFVFRFLNKYIQLTLEKLFFVFKFPNKHIQLTLEKLWLKVVKNVRFESLAILSNLYEIDVRPCCRGSIIIEVH